MDEAMIRILLADDHPIVREGLRAVLETQLDFEVVGTPQQAANGDEALRLALELQPDILLLDLEMPVMDGVETIRSLRQQTVVGQKPGEQGYPRVIVFTAFDNDERIIAALAAGANGYLLKGAPREDIFHAIRVTMQGGSLLQPVVASKLLRHMEQHERSHSSFEQQPTYETPTSASGRPSFANSFRACSGSTSTGPWTRCEGEAWLVHPRRSSIRYDAMPPSVRTCSCFSTSCSTTRTH